MNLLMKQSEEEPQHEHEHVQETGKVKRILRECFQMIVIPVALALFCGKVLIVNANIPSGSMENTIHPGDRVIGSRLAYLGKEPQREDIIIDKETYEMMRAKEMPPAQMIGSRGQKQRYYTYTLYRIKKEKSR